MALADILVEHSEETEWFKDAACRGTDPGLFFPDGTTTPYAQKKIFEAKQVCIQCKCISECLLYAIKTNQNSGIWGGRSETERRQIRRDLRNKKINEADVLNYNKIHPLVME